jgi:DNA-binding HxlR family transcriptional regulator
MSSVTHCHLPQTLKIIGGKWKLVILWHLSNSIMRFSELEKAIPGLTQKMPSKSLKELEKNRLISRKVYPVIPPKVEYSITSRGRSLGKILKGLDDWGRPNK